MGIVEGGCRLGRMGTTEQMGIEWKENREQSMRRRNARVREELSIESIFVSFVFFVVLSQFLVSGRMEFISQPFRPLIVIILAVQVVRRGRLKLTVCNVALAMAIYQLIIWFFLYTNPDGGTLKSYLVLVFYFLMLFSVGGFRWNRRELQLIIYVAFLATFVCAVVFFFSNNMLDFSEHDLRFLGETVNRNKNAYAFAIGLILGRAYLVYGEGRNKLVIGFMMLFEAYCLLYSKCRGAFLGVFITVCVVALFKIARMWRRGNPYLIFYILFVIIAVVIVYFLIKNSAVNRLVDNKNMSGRDEGFRHAWYLFQQASLAGKIFGNGIMYETNHTQGIGVHSVYLLYLLESGIVGTTLIILIFATAVRNIRGEIQWSLYAMALSRTFFEGMDYYIFIPLILSICISNYERLYGRSCKELFRRL